MVKIVIIGGSAGGASVATRARRLDESAQITMYERGPHVSFSNCALPYHLSETIANPNRLVLMTPEKFKNEYNIDAIVNHEVTEISAQDKKVTVKNVLTGEITIDDYDYLFLSPGASPVYPKTIKGLQQDNVYTLRNVPDVIKIHDDLIEKNAKHVAVIGGGFIGIEAAENLNKQGYHVTIIKRHHHLLDTVDDDIAQIIQKEMIDHDIDIVINDVPVEVMDKQVLLASGKMISADAVILAAGVKPDTKLAVQTGITLGVTGAIQVNQNYQTNLPNIYAVGDAIELKHAITQKPYNLSLAYPAQMQARGAVDRIYGRQIRNRGVIGSQCIPIFDLNVASTGLTEKQCQKEQIDYRSVLVIPKDKVAIMPQAKPLYLKLIFGYPDGKILGAQAVGRSAVDKQIDIIATAIQYHGYVEDLQALELCYQPEFSTTKNAVNMAGLVATNILNGEYQQVSVTQVRDFVEKEAYIIDIRGRRQFAKGHIVNAINIPMAEFRSHLDQVPKDRPVYLHCVTGKDSYNITRALVNLGYTNVYNISGSFSALCEYEYFRDVTENRTPIVTNYTFNL